MIIATSLLCIATSFPEYSCCPLLRDWEDSVKFQEVEKPGEFRTDLDGKCKFFLLALLKKGNAQGYTARVDERHARKVKNHGTIGILHFGLKPLFQFYAEITPDVLFNSDPKDILFCCRRS